MKRILAFLLLLGLASLTSAQSDTWTRGAGFSSPRLAMGTCTVDGRIYVMGGFEDVTSAPLATVELYDPGTGTLLPKADMPTPRGAMAVCEVGGQIYTIGGTGERFPMGAVEVYDPVTDTWAERTGASTARWAMAACPVAGRIYVFGGAITPGSIEGTTVAEVYDPATDTWEQLTDMPKRASGLIANAVDGMIYVMGWDNPGYVFRYNPSADAWTQLADVPGERARWGASSLVIRGKIYVIGGIRRAISVLSVPMVDVYDPATDNWTQLPDMGARRAFLGAASVDGRIYALGGCSDLDYHPIGGVEIYDTGLPTAIESLSWGGAKALVR